MRGQDLEESEMSFNEMFFIRDIVESFRLVKKKFWTYFLSILLSFIIAAVIFIGVTVVISIYLVPGIVFSITNLSQLSVISISIVFVGLLTTSIFLTFISPLYGISAEVIEATESYAERTAYYLKKYIGKFFIVSLIVATVGFFVPIIFIMSVKTYLQILGLYNIYTENILSATIIISAVFLAGGLNFMYPAIVARRSLKEALHETITIMRRHYLRIYPSQIIMLFIFGLIISPFIIYGQLGIMGLITFPVTIAISVYSILVIVLIIFLVSAYTIMITRIYWIINSTDVTPDAMYTKGIQLIGE